MKKAIIIGAGISGLSLAYYLQKAHPGIQLTIFEKKERSGGWIHTKQLGENTFEEGPRFFKTSKSRALLELIDDLGLQSDLIYTSNEAKKRFIYSANKLKQMPNLSMLSKILWPLMSEPFRKRMELEDETVHDFIMRRFRSKSVLDLFSAFSNGIYAGDLTKMSVKSSFPSLFSLENERGSIIKGAFQSSSKKDSSLFSLRGGMKRLIDRLQERINADIHLSTEVESVNPFESSLIAKGESYQADHIFITTPPKIAALLLSSLEKASSLLKKIKMNSLHLVSFGFKERCLKKEGFGYLVPASEDEKVLGCAFDSCLSPQKGGSRLTFLLGGALHPEVDNYPDEECIAISLKALKKHLQISQFPEKIMVKRARCSIPEYGLGHSVLIDQIEEELSNLPVSLLGNYLSGVAVNDCIYHAKERSSFSKILLMK